MNLIGQVVKMDVDADGKASGALLCARVAIEIAKPLRRGVLLRMNKTEEPRWFDVQYERLPFYCFACGILGHSEVDCPHPVARNEVGKLPYDVPLRAPEERRRRLPSFAEAAADTFGSGSSSGVRPSWTGAGRTRDSRASGGDGASHHSSSDPVEVQSPLKEPGTDPKAKGTAEGETNRRLDMDVDLHKVARKRKSKGGVQTTDLNIPATGSNAIIPINSRVSQLDGDSQSSGGSLREAIKKQRRGSISHNA